MEEPVKEKIVISEYPNIEVWITGNESDLIDIISDRALLYRDYVRNDTFFTLSDISSSRNIIVARAGRDNDLAVLYGLRYEGKPTVQHVDVLRFYVRDGNNIFIEIKDGEVFITYGNQKDLRTRFHYSEKEGWFRSPGNNRYGSDFPLATEPVKTEIHP